MRKSANKLTKHECKYASSPNYPQIKYEVMQKATILFNTLGQKLSQLETLPVPYRNVSFKISKGENLEHMPYMVLDYPQIQGKEFSLVMRTLFWWGHHLSCQLIIQTAALNLAATAANLSGMRKTRILAGSNLWNHNGRSMEYVKLKDLQHEQLIRILEQQTYLKLVSIHSIKNFNSFEETASIRFEQWLNRVVWA